MVRTPSTWNTATTRQQDARNLTASFTLGTGPASHACAPWQLTDPSNSRSAAGSDTLLLTPPSSPVSLVQYRAIGGVLDFYFFSGPSPQKVIEQYGELVGLPTWQPAWGFGFQLCRWGYRDINETREQVTKMREANIPLEVMWNDIDLYHALRDFTTDPVSFPADEMRAFIGQLVRIPLWTLPCARSLVLSHFQTANNQHYIPILDAGIAVLVNDSDVVRKQCSFCGGLFPG